MAINHFNSEEPGPSFAILYKFENNFVGSMIGENETWIFVRTVCT